MKIKYNPCKSNTDMVIKILSEDSIFIDNCIFEFDNSVLFETLNKGINCILKAYRDESGELYITVRRLYKDSCAEWDTGEYYDVMAYDTLNTELKSYDKIIVTGKKREEIEKEKKCIEIGNTIQELKKYLAETDYVALKIVEYGESVKKEYTEQLKKRDEARKMINALEAEMKG